MPNWCDTTYICEGPKGQLNQLYKIIEDCKKGKYNKIKNDFGNLWLGNVLIACGCPDPVNKRCRGAIYDFHKTDDGNIEIFMETAWCEQEDVRKYIKMKFPDIKIYYRDIEFGCENFCSNDIYNKYFKGYAFIDDGEGVPHTVESESELIKEIAQYKKDGKEEPEIQYFVYEEN